MFTQPLSRELMNALQFQVFQSVPVSPHRHWAPLEEPGSVLFAPSAFSGYFHVITLPAPP